MYKSTEVSIEIWDLSRKITFYNYYLTKKIKWENDPLNKSFFIGHVTIPNHMWIEQDTLFWRCKTYQNMIRNDTREYSQTKNETHVQKRETPILFQYFPITITTFRLHQCWHGAVCVLQNTGVLYTRSPYHHVRSHIPLNYTTHLIIFLS